MSHDANNEITTPIRARRAPTTADAYQREGRPDPGKRRVVLPPDVVLGGDVAEDEGDE